MSLLKVEREALMVKAAQVKNNAEIIIEIERGKIPADVAKGPYGSTLLAARTQDAEAMLRKADVYLSLPPFVTEIWLDYADYFMLFCSVYAKPHAPAPQPTRKGAKKGEK